MYLIRAATALSQGNDTQAEQHVNRSRQLCDTAMAQQYRPLHRARCYYWKCRIAWFRNDFLSARACLATARDIFITLPDSAHEMHQLDEYFIALRRKIPYADRRRPAAPQPQTRAGPHVPLRRHGQRQDQGLKTQNEMGENESLKRKRPQPRPRNPRSERKHKSDGVLRYEVVPYAMRPVHRRKERRYLKDPAPSKRVPRMMSTASKHGLKPVEQTHDFPSLETFTFTKYFTGPAPRTRPTNIFPKQPYERIYTQEIWERIMARAANIPVTMRFLMRERERMLKELDGVPV